MSTQPTLPNRVRDRLRYKQYSLRTEQTYKSPLDSGGTGRPPVVRDVTLEYRVPFSRLA